MGDLDNESNLLCIVEMMAFFSYTSCMGALLELELLVMGLEGLQGFPRRRDRDQVKLVGLLFLKRQSRQPKSRVHGGSPHDKVQDGEIFGKMEWRL